MDDSEHLQIVKSNIFDATAELKERFLQIGLEVSNNKIQINGSVYSPKFKIQTQKWAFFETIEESEETFLRQKGWKVVDISILKKKEDINDIISQLFK